VRPHSSSTLFPYATLFRSISRRAPPERMAELIGTLGTSGFVGMILGPIFGDLLFAHIDDLSPELAHVAAGQAVQWMFILAAGFRSEEHTSELQSRENLVCR